MSLTGLRHIALKTRDLKKTERFYTELLGLKIAFRVSSNMIFLRSPKGNDLLNFIKSNERTRSNQGLDHFGFKISKSALEGLEKRLKKNGVAIEGRRGRSSIYFRDPDDYLLEFYCD
jgi:catechol 2,3-dioxygenase-like lactoylglutathione lyase family enzyme